MDAQRISSAQNASVKHVRQLVQSSKYRHQHRQTVLEGIHVSRAFIEAGVQPLQVFVAESAHTNQEVSDILFAVDAQKIVIVPDTLFVRMSGLTTAEPTLLCVIAPPEHAAQDCDTDALLLENVQDPGNLGTMLRTAAAAGVKKVFVSRGSVNVWSPKVLRAGMGAHVALEIIEGADLRQVIQSASVPVLATSLRATQTIYERDVSQPTAWLFGNEGAGVSDELMGLCDDTVIIPQHPTVESLNVSAAVAVCLFETTRQRIA